MPAGWRERSIFVGRYGTLDIFHFDLYSVALSKIERGTERDFQDVVALIATAVSTVQRLDAAFHEFCRASLPKAWRAWIQQYSRNITTTFARCSPLHPNDTPSVSTTLDDNSHPKSVKFNLILGDIDDSSLLLC